MPERDRPDEAYLLDWYRRHVAEPAADAVLGDIENWRPTGLVDPDRPEAFTRKPRGRIEIRDPETGEVRAYWGEHGVFEVIPPRWGEAR